jgi:phosphomannomutase
MARAALDRPDLRLLFAYEQALGYLVTSRPLDKDGISAAVLLAEVAAVAAEEGTTLQGRLDDLAARYGRHVVAERALRMAPAQGQAAVRALQADPPDALDGVAVVEVKAYPEADLLRLVLEGGVRLQARPSGTEPKVKLYGEAVGADPGPFLDALVRRLAG